MSRPNPSNRSIHLLASLCMLWLCGCQLGTTGQEGELRFRDLTRYRSQSLFASAKLDRPLALGGKMTIEVSDAFGATVFIKQAEVKPQGVLSVSVSSSRVDIEAQSTGQATLTLMTTNGSEDEVSIEVVKPSGWSLIPSPWISLMPLPQTMWSKGLRLMTKSRMTVYGEALDSKGKRLMGHGSSQFAMSTNAASTLSVKPRSDECTVQAGSNTGPASLTFGNNQLDIDVVGMDAVATVKAMIVTSDGTVPLEPGTKVSTEAIQFVHLAAFDAMGAYIAGDGDLISSLTSSDSTVIEVISGAGNSKPDEDLQSLLKRGRAYIVSFNNPGLATLDFKWGGQTLQVPLEVVNAP